MRAHPILSSVLTFMIVAVLAAGRAAAAEEGTLEIATKSGVRVFAVELAVTDEERGQGLMFRKQLPEGRDMLFIKGDGRIARIAENTEVLSERVISSGVPVVAVLEVIGGTARKFGIAPGD